MIEEEEPEGRQALEAIDVQSMGFGQAFTPMAVGEALESTLAPENEETFRARYEIGRRLGAGGMGEVRVCRDVRVGRDVALKRMLPGRDTQEGTQRFVREARVQGRLQHPSIVPVHDLGVDPDGSPFFVMKRIQGKTFADVLKGLYLEQPEMTARYTRRRLLEAFVRACQAIDYAHQRGVLHRDLKPANLMLGDFGELYVLDWGLAKIDGVEDTIGRESDIALDDAHTREGSLLGTPGYAPPEQLRGRLEAIGPWSDVYAMGIVLYELLAVQRLLPSAGNQERLFATIDGIDARPSKVRPDVPPELDAICLRATSLEPSDRYPTMGALVDAVEAFLEGKRTEEMRRAVAGKHEARAKDVVRRDRGTLTTRKEALQELGQAVALRPTSPDANALLVALLDSPPDETPDEVQRDLRARSDDRARAAMKLGTVAYGLWAGLVPFLVWMGLRDRLPLWIGAGGLLVAIVCAWFGGRRKAQSIPLQYGMLIGSTVAIVCGSRIFGPFVLLPQIITATAFSYALTDSRVHRIGFVGVATLGLVVPFALEGFGVWGASYAFEASGILILPQLVDFPPGPTLACLWTITLLILVVVAFWAGSLRDELSESERSAAVQRWQLRQLFDR